MDIIKKYEENILPIKNTHKGDVIIYDSVVFIVSDVKFAENLVHAFSLWSYKMVHFCGDERVIVKPKACIKLDGDSLLRRCI